MNFISEHARSIGLVFFVGFFLIVLVRTYRPSLKKKMEEYGLIPFKGDSRGE